MQLITIQGVWVGRDREREKRRFAANDLYARLADETDWMTTTVA